MSDTREGERREGELRDRLAAVYERIDAACSAAGRTDPEDRPRLVVVTKFFPASDVVLLSGLGVEDVGENRDQEAGPKAAEVAQALPDEQLRWHFVGQLQSNKAASVARYAHSVHSVDRASLVKALSRGVERAGEQREKRGLGPLQCFVQVDLDEEPDGKRGGCAPDDVANVAEQIAAADGLELAGVMAVAPLGADPESAFAKLADISRNLRRDHPKSSAISAGMSGDLEAAIAQGATHLRVGSDVLGPRPLVR